MAVIKRPETPLEETFKKFRFDSTLSTLKPAKLTDAAIAKKLGVATAALSTAVILSPNKPRAGKKFLSFYSAMMVLADPAASNNIALFSSGFPSAVSPGLQVAFDPITAGKSTWLNLIFR